MAKPEIKLGQFDPLQDLWLTHFLYWLSKDYVQGLSAMMKSSVHVYK